MQKFKEKYCFMKEINSDDLTAYKCIYQIKFTKRLDYVHEPPEFWKLFNKKTFAYNLGAEFAIRLCFWHTVDFQILLV